MRNWGLQRWPVWNRSSQLKQRPLDRRSCISAGDKRLMGRVWVFGAKGFEGGVGSKGGFGD
jgi:hypothetical protein